VAVEGEVAEADVVSKGSPDGFAHRVEIGGIDGGDAAALLAAEVLAAAIAREGIEPGAVAEVDVADEAELLDALGRGWGAGRRGRRRSARPWSGRRRRTAR